MLKGLIALGLGGLMMAGATQGAMAQSITLDEVRGGIYVHSFDSSGLDPSMIQDANVELLFSVPSVDEALSIGRLRPHVGATMNFGGLESMVYAGVTWTVPLFDTPFFVEGAFGGAIHNGALDGAELPARNLGCPVLFHESASLGYQFSEQGSIMLTAEHASHADLCDGPNRGLSNIGVRVGWKF